MVQQSAAVHRQFSSLFALANVILQIMFRVQDVAFPPQFLLSRHTFEPFFIFAPAHDQFLMS
jgi:hypothetical protein